MSSASSDPDRDRDQDQDQDWGIFTVFDGSSPDDVSHARQLWSSLSLLPPQESRLVSADIRQRLPVSRPQRGGPAAAAAAAAAAAPAPEPPTVDSPRKRQEDRRRFEAMADQRREILALLRRQREQRIQKELISAAFKPKVKTDRERRPEEPPDGEEVALVRQLQ